jgi:hypothetical protein
MQQQHIWNFKTIGGVKRVNLISGNDLMNLKYLDQKLWTALSCPASDLEIDSATLKLIDSDGNDQIRAPELIDAVNWTIGLVADANNLLDCRDELLLSEINTQSDEGKLIYKSAKNILANLDKPDADRITLQDTSDLTAIFKNTSFNGDGIITTKSTKDEHLKAIIALVGSKYGTVIDRSGDDGINAQTIANFFNDAEAYICWFNELKANEILILPFKEQTDAAFAAFNAIKHKIDDYFLRCKLVSYDADIAWILNPIAEQLKELTTKNLVDYSKEIANTPISKPNSNQILNLTTGINPVWEDALNNFNNLVIQRVFPSNSTLSYNNWLKIKQLFEPYAIWLSKKPQCLFQDIDAIETIATPENKAALMQLIEKDLSVADEANGIFAVDKLLRYQKYLFELLQNFVTFNNFYTTGKVAIFQAGTLYIDQRSCDLCIKVNHMDKHNLLASLSGLFLLYCKCKSKKTGDEINIVAALTNGDIDNITVGRNAVFYDRAGNDWDATIVKIIENPISIRQAFFTPYRKVAHFIERQVNNFAQEQDNKVETLTTSKISETVTAKSAETDDTTAAKKLPPTPFDIGKFVGIFAAIGLALGAIGSTLTAFLSGFLSLVWWKIPFAIAGILLFISGPSMLMAYIKLRKRNLAPVLDANGWAINSNVNINISFGNTLTALAQLPPNATVSYFDPFKNKSVPWYKWLILVILLILIVYLLYRFKLNYMANSPTNLTP